MVGQASEHEGPQGPGGQRQGQGDADFGDLHLMSGGGEILGDVAQHEGQQEKVEGVERPAQQGGHERGALGLIQRLQLIDDHHCRFPCRPGQ